MKYFTINELLKSSTATARKIDNTPTAEIKAHLTDLVDNLLDIFREKWAAYCKENNLGSGAIRVTSGYRCSKLNKAVGGATTSAHMFGYAADMQPANGKQTEFEKFTANIFAKSGIKFDQIIIERSARSRWIHMGIKNYKGKQRMQCFKLSV